ncbi:hypothetical protein QWU00_11990 [Acetobacter tropicalis]|uniref:hypothetical protein n=1 Tax=Acetobacter tropicalis TaxID=104102 RepID=UPI00123B7FB8|nr:hypothetical protein [Acetobacter tropicalis]MDO8172460.1 hypothetical protein [Acetobacter tropicalis]
MVRYVLKLSWGREGLTADDRADGLVGIDELTPDELAWYYHATLGVTRVKPLRSFQVFCKSLNDNREEIRWVPRRDGKRELRRVQRPRLEPRPPTTDRHTHGFRVYVNRVLSCSALLERPQPK